MEELCGGALWNNSFTWNTEKPDFTPCFESTLFAHSEGKSLREGGKKRLGGNMHPQNGDIGGCVAGCVASEDYTIDQVRTLGGPDHISCWATSP